MTHKQAGPTPEEIEAFKRLPAPERFTILFGVSEEDLHRRGIDPDQYFHDNVRSVMKDKRKAALVRKPSDLRRSSYLKWDYRFFKLLSVTVILLLLTSVKALHLAALVAACVVFTVALLIFALSLRDYVNYLHACKAEGISSLPWRNKKAKQRGK